jgi:hypothetical protein
MATATFKFNPAPTIPGSDDTTQSTIRFFGTVTFSAAADTYATGGLLPLAGFALKNLGPYADRTPVAAYVESLAGSGLTYYYNIGTGKVQVFGGGGSGTTGITEITNGTALNGTTPQIFTDVVSFEIVVPRR